MNAANYLWLVVAFPLLGCAINAMFGGRFTKQVIAGVACGAILISFIIGLFAFFDLGTFDQASQFQSYAMYPWIAGADTRVDLSFLADPLAMVMVLVVSALAPISAGRVVVSCRL